MDEKIKDLATAIENDEVSNEEALEDLQYADGKERDEVDLAEEQEKIYGVDVVSPFKTADIRVFRRKLDTMSRDQMTTLANRVAARTYSSPEDQKTELLRAFHSWVSTNGFIQTDATKKAEKGALSEAFEGSESVNTLEEKLKSKTLDITTSKGFEIMLKKIHDDSVELFQASKSYSPTRNLFIYNQLKKGAIITKGERYKRLKSYFQNSSK